MDETNDLTNIITDFGRINERQKAIQYFDTLKDEEKAGLIGSYLGAAFSYLGTENVLAALLNLSPEVCEKAFKNPKMVDRLALYPPSTKDQERLFGDLFKKLSPETLDSFREALNKEQDDRDFGSWLLRSIEDPSIKFSESAPIIDPKLFTRNITPKSKDAPEP